MNSNNSQEIKISLGFLKDCLASNLYAVGIHVDDSWEDLKLIGSIEGKNSDTILVKILKRREVE